MKSIDDIIYTSDIKLSREDDNRLFYRMRSYGIDAKNKCVYIPKVEPITDDDIRSVKISFNRYKPEIGWYSGFPVEDSVCVDLCDCFYKDKNGYYSVDKIKIQNKIASIRCYNYFNRENYLGSISERITVSVKLDSIYTVKSKSDFGDFLNLVFFTNDDNHARIEWLQRNYSEQTIRMFLGKSKTAILIGTIRKQYQRFGKKYTRVKNCEILNDKGVSINNFSIAIRSKEDK